MSTYWVFLELSVVTADEDNVKLFPRSKLNFHAYFLAKTEEKWQQLRTHITVACQPIYLHDNEAMK